MKAVVMAAGKSTRTYPLTLTRPKPLLPVANRTILEHQLDALAPLVDEVILVVGYKAGMIEDRFGDSYGDISLRYVHQSEQLGTGHAVLECAGIMDEPFIAVNGDDLYDSNDLRTLSELRQGALAKTVDDPRLYGIYELTDGDKVVRLVEKPRDVFSKVANIGAYKFTPEVFDVLRNIEPSPRGEIEITSAVQRLADQGDFRVAHTKGYWLPVGYPWHLLDANLFMLETKLEAVQEGGISPAAHLSGNVAVGRNSEVRPGAVIDGPVRIGRECIIGPNCYIRPGTSIGDGCRVGQSVELKNTILMEGATVAHLSYLGDSIVGAGVNIGCGTVVANLRHDAGNVKSVVNGDLVDTGRQKLGAILGDGARTGVNTSIYPGRKLWPGTFTRPGRIDEEDLMEQNTQ